ncbi:hypothetical protein BOTCAL_0005g00080 [Botryotinia calthae]|uniref:Uncharacterized protein n=1 Tax=Botryotinia calthae TaxID=38488 RepID=A0A4Y8DJZ9_9HELO|nr:hypothetical protein BOTCAL_0005g00080 [Botryotinia calthae]
MICLYIHLFHPMVLVGRQDWKVFANVRMMSTLSLNMSTQAQAQHCREYMQPFLINTQGTSALAKHIVKLVKKKPKTSEESGSGVNGQKISQEIFQSMSYRLSSSIISRAGCSIVLLALYDFYLLLIALIVRHFAKEPSKTAFDISRRPYFRPGTGSSCCEHLFGVGWFLEWPGGQRPLNSTWPWSEVKLSILVLWGVCWMFYMRTQCWQQAQPHTSHSHSHLQTSLRKASRPSAFHLSPIAKIIYHSVSSMDSLVCFSKKSKDESLLPGATLPSPRKPSSL